MLYSKEACLIGLKVKFHLHFQVNKTHWILRRITPMAHWMQSGFVAYQSRTKA